MEDMTINDIDQPRTATGEFGFKPQSAPELVLAAPTVPLTKNCTEPVRDFGLTTDDEELLSWGPPATLTFDGRSWEHIGFGTWQGAEQPNEKVEAEALWAQMTANVEAGEPVGVTMSLPDGFVYTAEHGYQRVPQEGGPGENLRGDGVISGAEYAGQKVIDDALTLYAKTPVLAEELVHRGEYRHIGDGVWMKRCRECRAYIKTYGTIMHNHDFAEHEAGHGLEVPGYNVALLPR